MNKSVTDILIELFLHGIKGEVANYISQAKSTLLELIKSVEPVKWSETWHGKYEAERRNQAIYEYSKAIEELFK